MTAVVDDGAARHLKVGLQLPDLALPSSHGGAVSPARIGGLNIFWVYPWSGRPGLPNPPHWDDIPGAHGSTPEAEGFRDAYGDYVGAGIGVFGISGQDTAYQSEFSRRLGLPFAMLSDEGQVFQTALALPVFVTGGVTYFKRLTLVARDGVVQSVHYPIADPARHAADLLGALRLC